MLPVILGTMENQSKVDTDTHTYTKIHTLMHATPRHVYHHSSVGCSTIHMPRAAEAVWLGVAFAIPLFSWIGNAIPLFSHEYFPDLEIAVPWL